MAWLGCMEFLTSCAHSQPLASSCSIAMYRAKCVYSGAVVVLRGYAREELSVQAKERVWNEVQTLQNAQCPFMTKCFDAFEDQGWWWLVMENRWDAFVDQRGCDSSDCGRECRGMWG
jgi:hypothetical protein